MDRHSTGGATSVDVIRTSLIIAWPISKYSAHSGTLSHTPCFVGHRYAGEYSNASGLVTKYYTDPVCKSSQTGGTAAWVSPYGCKPVGCLFGVCHGREETYKVRLRKQQSHCHVEMKNPEYSDN